MGATTGFFRELARGNWVPTRLIRLVRHKMAHSDTQDGEKEKSTWHKDFRPAVDTVRHVSGPFPSECLPNRAHFENMFIPWEIRLNTAQDLGGLYHDINPRPQFELQLFDPELSTRQRTTSSSRSMSSLASTSATTKRLIFEIPDSSSETSGSSRAQSPAPEITSMIRQTTRPKVRVAQQMLLQKAMKLLKEEIEKGGCRSCLQMVEEGHFDVGRLPVTDEAVLRRIKNALRLWQNARAAMERAALLPAAPVTAEASVPFTQILESIPGPSFGSRVSSPVSATATACPLVPRQVSPPIVLGTTANERLGLEPGPPEASDIDGELWHEHDRSWWEAFGELGGDLCATALLPPDMQQNLHFGEGVSTSLKMITRAAGNMQTPDPRNADTLVLPSSRGPTAKLPSHRSLAQLAAGSSGRIAAVAEAWAWACIAQGECIDYRLCEVREAE